MDDARERFWTLANVLTLLRILCIPLLILALVRQRTLAALLIFTAAGLTDFFDGMSARLLHQKTRLGVTLDPAADKLLMTASFVALTFPGLSRPNVIPLAVTVTVIARDVAIALGALVVVLTVGKKPFLPTLWGKLSTAWQIGCVFLVLLFNYLDRVPGVMAWVYGITFGLTLVSGAHYFLTRFWKWMFAR